jgi:hypothetical protein
MDGEDGFVAEMRSGREARLARIEAACLGAIDRRTDVIVFGCTCMSPAHAEISRRLDRPVIDLLVTGHKMTELLLTLGLVSAPAPTPPLAAGLIRTTLLGGGLAGAQAVSEDACGDTCAVISEPASAT